MPIRPRSSLSTGTATGSKPVNISTWAPEARNRATAASNSSASTSGSAPGRRMSLPPPAIEIRPGDMAAAAGTCSATIWRSTLPRTARFA